MILVFTVSIVTNNSLEIDYSQGHYIQFSSIMHGTHFLPFTTILSLVLKCYNKKNGFCAVCTRKNGAQLVVERLPAVGVNFILGESGESR